MKNDVPFIANTDDGLHCQQAAYMMILRYFKPDTIFTFKEWDKITGFEPEKGTWEFASLLWFYRQGFEVLHMTLFDLKQFSRKGSKYLVELMGKEVGEWQIEHSNLELEIIRAKDLANTNIYSKEEPKISDIISYLSKGFLVRVLVNSRRLNGQEGYFGHAVVVIGYDDTGIFFHDPGPEAMPSRYVDFVSFEAAWADPNPAAKELDAIRLQE